MRLFLYGVFVPEERVTGDLIHDALSRNLDVYRFVDELGHRKAILVGRKIGVRSGEVVEIKDGYAEFINPVTGVGVGVKIGIPNLPLENALRYGKVGEAFGCSFPPLRLFLLPN